MSTTLRIWSNVQCIELVLPLLKQGIEPHELIIAHKQAEHHLDEIDIAFGQPNPDAVIRSRRVRWVQVSSAGYTRYDREDFRQAMRQRGGMLTNSSAVLSDPCAEHVLAMMMALARDLPRAWEDQHDRRTWPSATCRVSSRLLVGQSALIVGFGAIGRRLAELLAPFRMNLRGLRRSPSGSEPIPVEKIERIDELLPQADHVINLLPSAQQTRRLFDATRFNRMKKGARFYNIGRGDTVDQDALRAALESGHLAAAYLDVATPEPLPPGHPLWTTPNCLITPHSAGGHHNEHERIVRHFLENLSRYLRSEDLLDRII